MHNKLIYRNVITLLPSSVKVKIITLLGNMSKFPTTITHSVRATFWIMAIFTAIIALYSPAIFSRMSTYITSRTAEDATKIKSTYYLNSQNNNSVLTEAWSKNNTKEYLDDFKTMKKFKIHRNKITLYPVASF